MKIMSTANECMHDAYIILCWNFNGYREFVLGEITKNADSGNSADNDYIWGYWNIIIWVVNFKLKMGIL